MRLTFRRVIGLGLLVQLLVTVSLLRHESAEGQILGLYSARYALVLALNAVVVIGLLAAFALASRLERWLMSWTLRTRLLMVSVGSTVAAGICWLPVETPVKQWAAITLLVGVVIVVYHASGSADIRWLRRSSRLLIGVTAIALAVALFTALTDFPFSPDEAHWADYASTAARFGSIYARTWMMDPQPIVPGLGWSVAAYGLALEHLAFDIRVGRIWTFAAYCLMLIGLWLLTRSLYGPAAAGLSVALAVFSGVFFPAFDYRPHHQLGAATVFVGWLALRSRSAARPRAQIACALGAGLLALLSLQLHAAGLALAAGCSLYMLLALRQQPRDLGAFAAYVGGAGAGALIYLVSNIAPTGGVEAFVEGLVADRAERQSLLYFLTWPTLPEGLVMYAGLAFVLLRRSPADRHLLSFALPVFASMAVIDTQGYRTPTAPLFVIMAAAALVPPHVSDAGAGRRWLISGAAVAMLASAALANFNWPDLLNWLRGVSPPTYIYADLAAPLAAEIRQDDVVVGTHLLIWTLPDQPVLYSTAGEYGVMRRTDLDDPRLVWEAVQPTVVVDIPGQMELTDGLRRYMEAHDFERCTALVVGALTVNLYRPGC